MENLGETIKELRGDASLREAANRIGISHTYLDTIEKGFDKRSGSPIKPTPETLRLLSEAYSFPYEELMRIAGYIEDKKNNDQNNWNSKLPELTAKDELDMAKRMDKMKKDLIEGRANGQALLHKGEPMSEEAMESLLEALEMAERITTLANKKYAPNKYKNKDKE